MCGHLSKNDLQNFIEDCILFFPLYFHIWCKGWECGGETAKIPWIDVFSLGCGKLDEILSTDSQIPQSYYLSGLVSGWYCFWKNFSMSSYHFQILFNLYHVSIKTRSY